MYKNYLDIVPAHLRAYHCKLRFSAHLFRIETDRYGRTGISRNIRVCQYCSMQVIEDEFHFILKCPLYSNVRKQNILKYCYVSYSM